MTPGRARFTAAMLACMALVLWVRVLPLGLSAADDWADAAVRREAFESRDRYVAERAAAARAYRAELSFNGPGGREHVYLGDFDSYHWLRMARNHLERGTPCDAIVNGQCRDTLAAAPVGSRMIYTRSVHVGAIVAVHRALTRVDPGFPLAVSAFLVPVIVGVLGVIPAFVLGHALGGIIGGVFAALLISLNPVLLGRSLGSDNDVWNAVLPLGVLAAAAAGFSARDALRAAGYGALAGAVTALHATTWRGWLFAYGVVVSTVVVALGMSAARHATRARERRVWRAEGAGRIAALGLAYVAASGALMWAVGYETAYGSAFSMLTGDEIAPPEPGHWPSVLRTVAEFSKPGLREIARSAGSMAVFFGGVVGLLLLLLPAARWRAHHVVVCLAGVALAVFSVVAAPERNLTVALFALALAGPAVARVFDAAAPPSGEWAPSLLLAAWFLAALLFSHEGARYVTLLTLPVSVTAGVLAHRLYAWVGARSDRLIRARPGRLLARTAALAVLALVLVAPVRQGYATARDYLPSIDDAWWLSLERIKRESAPDAIVNTWWDYGYWVKYVAERRVSTTGGSLLTHVPHWMAKAFAAPSEGETIGLLRMLNCGSDAMPLREGRHGAYGKLVATGRDAVSAYAIVLAVVGLERGEADAYLVRRGFAPADRSAILASTHCAPPESYLILTSELRAKSPAWLYLGAWDMRRAYIAREARAQPPGEAVPDLVARLGYSAHEAARLHAAARALTSGADVDHFIAPRRGQVYTKWHACLEGRAPGRLACPLDGPGLSTLAFVYDPAAPQAGRLRRAGAEGREPSQPDAGTPAVIVVAGTRGLEHALLPAPSHPDVGILVDVVNRRILVGIPELIRSTFTQLMYLDGRYATRFEKVDDRSSLLGNRVVVWKVKWQAR